MKLGGIVEIKIIKGTNQIGGCITEITSKDTKILIDFGNDLEDIKEPFELDGLTYNKSIYDAVFITHSHMDHIGLINKINKDIPIYVEESSLKIYNITCDFCSEEKLTRKVNTFSLQSKEPIEIKNIKITPYRVDHSSYNSCMFLIECEDKKILHTGDYRLHGRKKEETINNLKKIGKVDLLITEGTSLTRNTSKYDTEEQLENKALEYMKHYDQVFIMHSSTNIDRTISFIKSALKTNKNYILDLFTYSLNQIINVNIKVDYKRIFVWKPIRYFLKDEKFKSEYMDFDNSSYFGKKYAMNVKVSMLEDIKKLKEKGLITNACIIYSMWHGYIEKDEKLKCFLEEIKNMNIEFKELHTSGHADINSMKELNKIITPNKTIIIHTESQQNNTEIFNNVIKLTDNETFEL